MRYLIGLLITIAVIIFVIIRLLTGGGGEPKITAPQLASYADTDTIVRLSITNSIQAAKEHRIVEITVGRDATNFVLYKGYDRDVVRAKTYEMSSDAYRDFLRGLDLTGGYTKGNDDTALRDDHGYCALGSHTVYEIINPDGKTTQYYWSTSCGQKTFKGDVDAVQELFIKQVPDYYALTSDVDFN